MFYNISDHIILFRILSYLSKEIYVKQILILDIFDYAYEPRHEKPTFDIYKNKDTNQLRGNCAFVFTTWIEQYLYFLNPKFQVSSH